MAFIHDPDCAVIKRWGAQGGVLCTCRDRQRARRKAAEAKRSKYRGYTGIPPTGDKIGPGCYRTSVHDYDSE